MLLIQGEGGEEADAALAPHLRHQLHRLVSLCRLRDGSDRVESLPGQ